MKKIREFCTKNRIYVFFAVLVLAILLSILQIEIFSTGYGNIIYQPFLINFFGISFVAVFLWILSLIFIALYTKILTKKGTKFYLATIPLIIILEVSAISSFFTFNPDGIFPSSYGGLLGEFIIKWPTNWDRYTPTLFNYSTGVIRFILLNILVVTIFFPRNVLSQSKKLISFILTLIKSISSKSKKQENNNISNDDDIPYSAVDTIL